MIQRAWAARCVQLHGGRRYPWLHSLCLSCSQSCALPPTLTAHYGILLHVLCCSCTIHRVVALALHHHTVAHSDSLSLSMPLSQSHLLKLLKELTKFFKRRRRHHTRLCSRCASAAATARRQAHLHPGHLVRRTATAEQAQPDELGGEGEQRRKWERSRENTLALMAENVNDATARVTASVTPRTGAAELHRRLPHSQSPQGQPRLCDQCG